MEVSAVRKAVSINNFPNQTFGVDGTPGKGLRCFRCGSSDRMLENCPHPFTQKLAFSPTTPPVGKGKKAKQVHFSEQPYELEDGEAPAEVVPDEETAAERPNTMPEIPVETYETDLEEQTTDEEWLQQWMAETIMYSETDLTWYNRGEEISERDVLPDQENIFVSTTQQCENDEGPFICAMPSLGELSKSYPASCVLGSSAVKRKNATLPHSFQN